MPAEPSAIYIFTKHNYKVYANIDETSPITRIFSAILDSAFGSSLICFGECPPPLYERNKPLDGSLIIQNASGKTIPFVESIHFVVQIVTSQSTLTFLVAKQTVGDSSQLRLRLLPPLHVVAIRPRHRHV